MCVTACVCVCVYFTMNETEPCISRECVPVPVLRDIVNRTQPKGPCGTKHLLKGEGEERVKEGKRGREGSE